MKLRPATDADRDYFLGLRNDPDAVAASPTGVIDPERHNLWWRTTASMRLILDHYGVPIGIGRLDPDGEISIVVDRLWRMDGLGTEAVAQLMQLCRSALRITPTARIKADNAVSLICFIKAGMRPVRITDGMVYLEADPAL